MRMIHHSTRWMTFSSDSVKTRNGSAFLPALSAAMPTTAATTMTCRMLKPTLDEKVPSAAPGLVLTVRPRKFCGMSPSRKFHQVPTVYGSPGSRPSPARLPGWITRPRTMPMITAMNAVIANHRIVWPARRAAFCTRRRFEMLATIAVKIRGTTAARSSVTYELPMVSSVADSPVGFSAVAPSWRPIRPAAMPRTRAARIWKPNEVSSFRTGPRVSGAFWARAVVLMRVGTPESRRTVCAP